MKPASFASVDRNRVGFVQRYGVLAGFELHGLSPDESLIFAGKYRRGGIFGLGCW
jgi:hypothetical protein